MDDKHLAKTIGGAAKTARVALGYTQEDAADAIGVSTEFFSRIERGRTLPSVPTLRRLAEALQVSVDKLLGFERATSSIGSRRTEADKLDAATRKLNRRLQRAPASTKRLVGLLLHEIESGGRPKRASQKRR